MKTTGIIRRIDDLGRIVIPKELRKTLKIKNGDCLEILINDEEIILKKYSPMESLTDIAKKYAESFSKIIKHNVLITDKDKILAATGSQRKNYFGKNISSFVVNIMERRINLEEKTKKEVEFIENLQECCFFCISPIFCNTDIMGCVIIYSTETRISESDGKVTQIISSLLGNSFVD